jgi:SanA protein
MSKKKKTRKRLIVILIILIFSVIGVIWIANRIIEKKTDDLVYSDVNAVGHNKIGLLLGTSQYLKSGKLNQYFLYRIDAAVELYNAQKINYIVVSGDNRKKNYNEPLAMYQALIARGIPPDKIYLDYAGFRTYDSVIRLNKIFGQRNFTVISQEFHNRRAVYIAKRIGLNAIGFNAKDVDAYNGFKTRLREKFSRVKVFIDLQTNKQPKFLGEEISIP